MATSVVAQSSVRFRARPRRRARVLECTYSVPYRHVGHPCRRERDANHQTEDGARHVADASRGAEASSTAASGSARQDGRWVDPSGRTPRANAKRRAGHGPSGLVSTRNPRRASGRAHHWSGMRSPEYCQEPTRGDPRARASVMAPAHSAIVPGGPDVGLAVMGTGGVSASGSGDPAW